ncbi:MAG TPA: hypothetical protein VHB77_04815, partial [Planctomycetaceae bacterium]|nr:hypothetical protein [Planctomycetaceae bacterium]
KLVPSKRGISVDFDLIDHANKNKSTHYHGTMTLPPVKLGGEGQVLHSYETMKFGFVQKPEERAVLIKTQAGRDALELELVGRWNSIERRWRTRLPNLGNVEFVTAGQVPTADSPEAKSRVAFQAALKLMQPGKMDEAKMAFEKVIDAYPETSGAESAKHMLSRFDQVKAGQAKAEEMRKSQEEFQRRMQQDQPQPSRKPKKPAKK